MKLVTTTDTHEAVYTFLSGFIREAEATYKWLQYYGLTPRFWLPKGGGVVIELPVKEVPCLRLLQRRNPARFGNAPAAEEEATG